MLNSRDTHTITSCTHAPRLKAQHSYTLMKREHSNKALHTRGACVSFAAYRPQLARVPSTPAGAAAPAHHPPAAVAAPAAT